MLATEISLFVMLALSVVQAAMAHRAHQECRTEVRSLTAALTAKNGSPVGAAVYQQGIAGQKDIETVAQDIRDRQAPSRPIGL